MSSDAPSLTTVLPAEPDRHHIPWRLLAVSVFGLALYAGGICYWTQYQVESFCEDQVVLGGSSEGIATAAEELGFRVRSGPTRDETTGIMLIHGETLFGTSYCDIQYIDGTVVGRTAGWF
jgi:hypothetical protein